MTHPPKGLKRGPQTAEHKARISAANKGRKKPSMAGDKNHKWKGEAASYSAHHHWIARQKSKTGVCGLCNREGPTEWANIDHEYRRDPDDWHEWCKSCHYHFDDQTFGTRNRTRDATGRYTN